MSLRKRRPSQRARRNPATNNAAVKHSLHMGIARGEYLGELPVYSQSTPGGPFIKIREGVPFVRRERAE